MTSAGARFVDGEGIVASAPSGIGAATAPRLSFEDATLVFADLDEGAA